MRRISNPDYKPVDVFATGLAEASESETPVAIQAVYTVTATCPDGDYGAGNPDQNDFSATNLHWLIVSGEFIRGGFNEESHDAETQDQLLDHLLAYDAETGYWHPVGSTQEKVVALDYEVRYTDVVIETSLVIGGYEDDTDD